MATKLFVGSLPYSTTDQELEQLFAGLGTVVSARVIVDRETNRSKGFGFVEMGSEDEAKKAIDQLNGSDFNGRNLVVSEARPQEKRERRSFDGGNRGGGYNRDSY
jgi:RNA recognition motif-containing protein